MTFSESRTNVTLCLEIIAQFYIPGEIRTSFLSSWSHIIELGLSYPYNLKEMKSGSGDSLFAIGKFDVSMLLIHPKS
jgi:hypothetical protein